MEMDYSRSSKYNWVMVFLVAVMLIVGTECGHVQSKGECAPSTPDREAFKMMPCMGASKDADYPVSQRCCDQVKKLGQSTSCLCAVMLSKTAELVGSKPEIAITIPKRCNIVDRPVGYNCGGYILP
ncbi:hypothetical protein IC582_004461 [Cucumis melo]|uniref:Uncharacterized protein LOC103485536 isoform X2 n=1 Tax=Cucumis melo TaxID=3656 RepID=A0A1S3B414_CUCME|nr:uncharacterized protein LOC103485536 isoform X2 [Cucumis melo]